MGGIAGTAVGGAADEPMYMVVGFEVMACSIARVAGQKPKDVSCIDTLEGKPPAPQEITKGMARAGDCPTACSAQLGLSARAHRVSAAPCDLPAGEHPAGL